MRVMIRDIVIGLIMGGLIIAVVVNISLHIND